MPVTPNTWRETALLDQSGSEWGKTSHPFMDENGMIWSETNNPDIPWLPYWMRVPGATSNDDIDPATGNMKDGSFTRSTVNPIGQETPWKLWDKNDPIFNSWVPFKQPAGDISNLGGKWTADAIEATYAGKSYDYGAAQKASDYDRDAVRYPAGYRPDGRFDRQSRGGRSRGGTKTRGKAPRSGPETESEGGTLQRNIRQTPTSVTPDVYDPSSFRSAPQPESQGLLSQAQAGADPLAMAQESKDFKKGLPEQERWGYMSERPDGTKHVPGWPEISRAAGVQGPPDMSLPAGVNVAGTYGIRPDPNNPFGTG